MRYFIWLLIAMVGLYLSWYIPSSLVYPFGLLIGAFFVPFEGNLIYEKTRN